MKVYQKVWIPDHDKNATERPGKDEEFIKRGPAMVEKTDYDALAAELAEAKLQRDSWKRIAESGLGMETKGGDDMTPGTPFPNTSVRGPHPTENTRCPQCGEELIDGQHKPYPVPPLL